MMKDTLEQEIASIAKELFGTEITVELARTDEQHGDFATNAAMQLSGKLGKNPREVAEQLVAKLREQQPEVMIEIAGPGFINLRMPDAVVWQGALHATELPTPLQGKTIVAEYSDPNPFKVLHAGHLYTTLVGDAVANILEAGGAKVARVNFGGDVGLHVAKAMWGIIQELGGEYPEKLEGIAEHDRATWISACYVKGNTAYAESEQSKAEIGEINKKVYALHTSDEKTAPFAQLYWTCRQWSYDGFEQLYQKLQVKPFAMYYPESETSAYGIELVEKGRAEGIFEESDGAVVYKGEKDGLHTRVFLTGEGLPTYEAKDLGLAERKWQDYHFDQSIIITAGDIIEYMRVVVKVLSHFHPELADRTKHLTHGLIKMPGGEKMSSRTGKALLADDILDAARQASQALERDDEDVILGAVKYSFLKNRIGGDIIYDPKESVSMEGNSGPYLQYALVRAKSILQKAGSIDAVEHIDTLEPGERSLAVQLGKYPEVFNGAVQELSPHAICSYLYETAQVFNRFYENNRVVDDPRSAIRVQLVSAYSAVLAGGLTILGIPTPERM